ncbi:MAG: HIT domain-containing protein [Alphaproteobacteria bacterium]|nr:MAG: HIT domain-containing protein [Alphaproteobacteria bacterium]
MYDNNNIFAKILRNEVSCKKAKEGDYYLAFHDLFPKADTHILIIPKGQYVTYHDFTMNASAEEKLDFFNGIAEIVKEFGLDQTGYKLHNNNLEAANQVVPHFHVHILGWKNANGGRGCPNL